MNVGKYAFFLLVTGSLVLSVSVAASARETPFVFTRVVAIRFKGSEKHSCSASRVKRASPDSFQSRGKSRGPKGSERPILSP
ncbi:exported hypothetical protein [Candidatus Methylacidithermus pantelleriae]|uniref:Secreted protein n=1 Tax=Candidatus Methylacidithermus pantelleriae TaxID=2744239 RepID=A0A8J2BM69_9BACT|nr:exported hypothetical protein [Candidatus Methylacidithermus pantelleriae]